MSTCPRCGKWNGPVASPALDPDKEWWCKCPSGHSEEPMKRQFPSPPPPRPVPLPPAERRNRRTTETPLEQVLKARVAELEAGIKHLAEAHGGQVGREALSLLKSSIARTEMTMTPEAEIAIHLTKHMPTAEYVMGVERDRDALQAKVKDYSTYMVALQNRVTELENYIMENVDPMDTKDAAFFFEIHRRVRPENYK